MGINKIVHKINFFIFTVLREKMNNVISWEKRKNCFSQIKYPKEKARKRVQNWKWAQEGTETQTMGLLITQAQQSQQRWREGDTSHPLLVLSSSTIVPQYDLGRGVDR